ncbi:MAG TPA: hypothetical protein ENK67_02825 [Flavobacteriia bacterium]|nr:hypothetical protein [Flavobacteriia bacterium]
MILFTKYQFKNYIGLAIFPFIIINKKYKEDIWLINHEKIHLKQQIELLWIGFFIWYIMEFLYRYTQHKNWHKAYQHISFERECNQQETDLNYLKKRKLFSFWKYL